MSIERCDEPAPKPLPRRTFVGLPWLLAAVWLAGCGGNKGGQAQNKPASCPRRSSSGGRSRGGASYAR